MKHTLQLTAEGDREIVIVRAFDAPRQLLFDCWTQPPLIRRWLTGPEDWSFAVCEVDLQVGGRYRYVWRNQDGRDMGMGGIFREVVPGERLVSTELFDEDWTGGETLVTITFKERGTTTAVTTTVLYSSKETRDMVLKSGMAEGLEAGYDRLEQQLATLA